MNEQMQLSTEKLAIGTVVQADAFVPSVVRDVLDVEDAAFLASLGEQGNRATPFSFEASELPELPPFDETLLANWRKSDIPVMLLAGILGGMSSAWLRDFFASLHDEHWGKLTTLEGGHSGECTDAVPGSGRSGGFGHRWGFGHDLLNPFEVDWDQYRELAAQSGTILPLWMKAAFYWLRHLVQDLFSKEGVALPGHSLLRWLLDPAKNPAHRDVIQSLLTIKMRDVAGASVTSLLMGVYLGCSERSLRRATIAPNSRVCALMAGANLVAVLTGLSQPMPLTSLNYPSLCLLFVYWVKLVRLGRRMDKALDARDFVLAERSRILEQDVRKLRCLDRVDAKACQRAQAESLQLYALLNARLGPNWESEICR